MFDRFFVFGVRQLFGGARRGQPGLTALGAAITIWGLSRKLARGERQIYSRELKEGETIRIRMWRGDSVVNDVDVPG